MLARAAQVGAVVGQRRVELPGVLNVSPAMFRRLASRIGRAFPALRVLEATRQLSVQAHIASPSEAGIALLEVLVTAVVVGIAAIGVAFMFSFGNTSVVAKGDDRVALSLAQQKIEQLRAGGYSSAIASGASTTESAITASGVASDRKFNRITCVQNVTDIDVSSPAYAGVAPSYAACVAGAATKTKRITVVVQPAQSANQLYADPAVILEAWITSIPGGI